MPPCDRACAPPLPPRIVWPLLWHSCRRARGGLRGAATAARGAMACVLLLLGGDHPLPSKAPAGDETEIADSLTDCVAAGRAVCPRMQTERSTRQRSASAREARTGCVQAVHGRARGPCGIPTRAAQHGARAPNPTSYLCLSVGFAHIVSRSWVEFESRVTSHSRWGLGGVIGMNDVQITAL
jgi:hypothetical protein